MGQLTLSETHCRNVGVTFQHAGYSVTPISAREANAAVVEHHYLHRRPNNQHSFGLIDPYGCLTGVVIFGTPASRAVQVSCWPDNPSGVLELCRLWVRDELERNAESFLVSRALHQLPPRLVVSYADTTYGHVGIVYRALNFYYAGWTDMDRKTPRFDYVTPNGAHSRDAFRDGSLRPRWTSRVRRKPKAKYWIATGNRRERNQIERACSWPSISWHDYPVPMEHVHLVIPRCVR